MFGSYKQFHPFENNMNPADEDLSWLQLSMDLSVEIYKDCRLVTDFI